MACTNQDKPSQDYRRITNTDATNKPIEFEKVSRGLQKKVSQSPKMQNSLPPHPDGATNGILSQLMVRRIRLLAWHESYIMDASENV